MKIGKFAGDHYVNPNEEFGISTTGEFYIERMALDSEINRCLIEEADGYDNTKLTLGQALAVEAAVRNLLRKAQKVGFINPLKVYKKV